MPDAAPHAREPRLTARVKAIYSTGDHTVNIVLTAMTLLYFRYLTDELGFAGILAGAIPWVGRIVDAFTDPAMGRISDHTRWSWGRRRPYLLIGCIPFGISFVLMWLKVPLESELARFAYYAGVYVFLSVSMTVVSVPYLALIPEMSRDYDERTSLNTWRAAFGILGVFVTVGMSFVARRLGDDVEAWVTAATVVGVWLVLPWLAVYRVTWERPFNGGHATMRLGEGMRTLWQHHTYRILCWFYIVGRIVIDVVSTMFIFYVTWVLGRRSDFEPLLAFFLFMVLVSLPFWLRMAERFDKRSVFVAGILWWTVAQFAIGLGDPDWPRWMVFLVAGLAGIGYGVADFVPWSMLPDVIDEDELATGERREGLYTGMFTFLRKIGGATAVLLIGGVLQLAGYDGHAPEQSPEAVTAIRILMAAVPCVLLLWTAWIARRYPLSREAHHEILEQLHARGLPR